MHVLAETTVSGFGTTSQPSPRRRRSRASTAGAQGRRHAGGEPRREHEASAGHHHGRGAEGMAQAEVAQLLASRQMELAQ